MARVKANVIRAQKKKALARFYSMNSILENQKKIFYILIAPKNIGKTKYSGANDGKR